jgi:hypothetical protein
MRGEVQLTIDMLKEGQLIGHDTVPPTPEKRTSLMFKDIAAVVMKDGEFQVVRVDEFNESRAN